MIVRHAGPPVRPHGRVDALRDRTRFEPPGRSLAGGAKAADRDAGLTEIRSLFVETDKMRKFWALAVAGALFTGVGLLKADEGKKVTIEGDGVCAKCALKEKDTCQNVVIVKKDGETKTYYIVHDKVSKAAHAKAGFCRASKDKPAKVKVTGTCEKKDGKLVLTAEKIEKVKK